MFHRFDLYAQVHKGIRLALNGLCSQAGSVDSSDDGRVKSFIEEFKQVAVILECHSKDEDTHINEFYEKYAPETLHQLEEEHSALDQNFEKIVKLVDRLELVKQNPEEHRVLWYQIGKDLNRFTADYFIHLQREEGPGMKALWNHLTDDQIKEISLNIRSSIPPQTMFIFLHYMIPAMSRLERFEMLSGMKKFAPKEAYAGVLKLAESRLDPNSWVQLQTALNEIQPEGVNL